MDPVLIFLAIAVLIIAMALFLGWVFQRKVQKQKNSSDPNSDPRDGDAIATWSGINEIDDH